MRSLVVIYLFLAIVSLPCLAAEPAGGANTSVNPHGQTGRCDVCHVASEEDLNSWFTFASTKKAMKKDLNALCQQCHGVEFGHGIGKWTKFNRDGLPMDAQGYIACAITCHDMHVNSQDQHQNRFHLRAPSMKLCLSCHNQ